MQGEDFKSIRKRLNFTQSELGQALELTRETIGLLERGAARIDNRTALAMRYLDEHPDIAMKGGMIKQ